MLTINSFRPSKIKGTIKTAKPIQMLCRFTDIDGVEWDVGAIVQNTVLACRVSELHPYYNDTSNTTYSSVSQTWEPYFIEVQS